jgi:membrane protease YdiL (CAAX protease family)
MLSSFKSIKSTWLKVLIFGLLFGLFHLDPYRFVPTAILGALFTFIVLRTGNIIIAMAIHFLHDFISIAVGYAQRDIITDDTIAAAQTAVTSQTIVAVLIVAVFPLAIGLALLRKEKTNKTPSERLLER